MYLLSRTKRPTFHKFSELPAELRSEIYELANRSEMEPNIDVHEYQRGLEIKLNIGVHENERTGQLGISTFSTSKTPPALLSCRTNRENVHFDF